MIGLIGRKIGMTQLFDDQGRAVPVTVLAAGPCPIVQIKTADRDGYTALQIGFGSRREKRMTAPERGHLAKRNAPMVRFLREVRVDDPSTYQVGQQLTVSVFEVGSRVDVVGVSKGRGFAGVIRRHHFRAGKETHGCTTHKQPGSIGASAYPSRVIKGKRLPGRMGGGRTTVKNLSVIGLDAEQNLIWVRGSVPGPVTGTLMIRKAE